MKRDAAQLYQSWKSAEAATQHAHVQYIDSFHKSQAALKALGRSIGLNGRTSGIARKKIKLKKESIWLTIRQDFNGDPCEWHIESRPVKVRR